jgi:hypothetical protein
MIWLPIGGLGEHLGSLTMFQNFRHLSLHIKTLQIPNMLCPYKLPEYIEGWNVRLSVGSNPIKIYHNINFAIFFYRNSVNAREILKK